MQQETDAEHCPAAHRLASAVMRILVTGSRGWADEPKMAQALGPWFSWDNVLVSGHNPRGADSMAERLWAGWLDMTIVKAIGEGYIGIYPADWGGPCRPSCRKGHRQYAYGRDYCPAAGNYRNDIMVNTGISACIAFLCQCMKKQCSDRIAHPTHGSKDCADRAEAKGIPVTWISDD